MRNLLIAVLYVAAAGPAFASSDEYHEMRAAQREMRAKTAEAKEWQQQAKKHVSVMANTAVAKPGSEAREVLTKLTAAWKDFLVAIGEDSHDRKNYPNILLACDVVLQEDEDVPGCGSGFNEVLENEKTLHRVLAHKTVNVLISMRRSNDAVRLERISTGIEVLQNFQARLTDALDQDGRRYRYAYDQRALSNEGFQKDVRGIWESAREISGILETELKRRTQRF